MTRQAKIFKRLVRSHDFDFAENWARGELVALTDRCYETEREIQTSTENLLAMRKQALAGVEARVATVLEETKNRLVEAFAPYTKRKP